uniref:(northern house mosquito) hypothetical protein n=2 Tax=Culex pipiens TaxID=7175 RepID=A0A8D8AX68_CULPI
MVEERRGTKQTSQVVHVLRLDPPVAFQGQTLEHVRLSLTVKVRRVPAKATVKASADYRELNVVERLVVHHIQVNRALRLHRRTNVSTAASTCRCRRRVTSNIHAPRIRTPCSRQRKANRRRRSCP